MIFMVHPWPLALNVLFAAPLAYYCHHAVMKLQETQNMVPRAGGVGGKAGAV